MKTLNVNLGERSYPIHIGCDMIAGAGDLLAGAGLRGKAALVTNPTIADYYLPPIRESLTRAGFEVLPVFVPDGEEHKDHESLAAIYDAFVSARLERRSCVVALGGGVVGDLAGFAAATYLRGVPYVQIPTTLLAQVDSSVGGKTGINHREGKNLIGAFYQPRMVLIDVAALRTLPRREFLAGLAEVIKYGIIEDSDLFQLLESKVEALMRLDPGLLMEVIAISCAIKARVVEKDEREDDYRAVLNFGHTLGHALEAATAFRAFLHGEAVSIGMAKAAIISAQHGLCDALVVNRIHDLLEKCGLPTRIPTTLEPGQLIHGLELDKKSADGKIKFVLCEKIGRTRFHNLSAAEILAALERQ
jgi:3-dehydroquinate synthase